MAVRWCSLRFVLVLFSCYSSAQQNWRFPPYYDHQPQDTASNSQWPQTPQRPEAERPQKQAPQRPESQWLLPPTPQRLAPQWPLEQIPPKPETKWPQLPPPKWPEHQRPQQQTPPSPEQQWPLQPIPQWPEHQRPQQQINQRPQPQTPQKQDPQWPHQQTPQRPETYWPLQPTLQRPAPDPEKPESQWTLQQTPQRPAPQWPLQPTPQRPVLQWPLEQIPLKSEPKLPPQPTPKWPGHQRTQQQTPQRLEPQWPLQQTPQRPETQWPLQLAPQWPEHQRPQQQIPLRPQLPIPQKQDPQWPHEQIPQRPKPYWTQPETHQRPEPQRPEQKPSKRPDSQWPHRKIPPTSQPLTYQRVEPNWPQPQFPQGPGQKIPQRLVPQWPHQQNTQRPAVPKTPDQRCQVQAQNIVKCGTPKITQVQCQAIDCCYNGQQCYYGKAVTVQCTKDAQFVVVVSREATWPKINIDSISLLGGNDSPCIPVGITSAFAIYQFPVTACGTTLKEESGYVVYENRMASSYEVLMGPRGYITRDSHFELLFQCKYSANAVEALVLEINSVPAPVSVAALGPLRVELRLAKGACDTKGCKNESRSFASYYTQEEFPVVKVLKQPVYVEVRILERKDPNLVLMLDYCWATSSPSPVSMPQWELLIEECPYLNDRYLTTMIPVELYSGLLYPTHHKRFIVEMFTFVDHTMAPQKDLIFLHCGTSVCHPTPGKPCQQKCNRQSE
uniref:Zona pellucida sperm-binding protein 4 n=1 Tax=Esox lucius TaxID=8010 RepID=A0A3P8XU96_ESOLU